MTLGQLSSVYRIGMCLLTTCFIPIVAHSGTDKVVSEKHALVAMRMIGHEILKSLGDSTSRVLPIEKTDVHYRIPFEFEFGFDPDEIVSIVSRVMKETEVSSHYLAEVEQCETKEIVHSFEVGNRAEEGMTPCRGRMVPKDCYSLLVTLLDDKTLVADRTSDPSVIPMETQNTSPVELALFIVPLLLLIGVAGYLINKRSPAKTDPDMISIGASRFDTKNMVLSFENTKTELSNKEAELLSLLHTSANTPLSREVILQQVWGDEGDYIGRTLDVFISKLRKKLEADTSVKIVNIRGVGYKLVVGTPM